MKSEKWYSVNELKGCPLCLSDIPAFHLSTSSAEAITNVYRNLVPEFISEHATRLYNCQKCDLYFYSPQLIGSSRLYSELRKHDWYYMASKPEYQIAAERLPIKGSILEFGAGSGEFRKYLGSEVEYAGTELAPDKELRSLGITIESEIDSRTFEAVISFQFMEHISNIRESLERQWSYLRPGGVLMFAVPSFDGFLRYAHESALNHPPHHLSLWTDDCLSFISNNILIGSQLELVHEKVAEFHKNWANAEMLFGLLRRIFRIPNEMIYWTKRSTIAWKFAIFITRYFPLTLTRRGHTVIAIYRKAER
jgi:SAM-dependent methyltransferase